MHRSARLAAGLLLTAAATLAGCGGDGAATPRMSIEFESQALLADADLVAIYFYEETRQCAEIAQTTPRPRSVLGPFSAALDAGAREVGIVSRIEDIPVGTYVVFADALRSNGDNVGWGCAAGQQVFDRKISEVRIVIASP